MGQPLTDKFLLGTLICSPCIPSFLHANDGDFELVWEQHYLLPVRLIKEKIFVLFEVSNRCSDIHKLYSVIRDGSINFMYKISYKQFEKNSQNSWLGARRTAAILSGGIPS